MISARYSLTSGIGGKAATQLVLDTMKQDGKYNKVILCYIDGNDAAKNLMTDSDSSKPTVMKMKSSWNWI